MISKYPNSFILSLVSLLLSFYLFYIYIYIYACKIIEYIVAIIILGKLLSLKSIKNKKNEFQLAFAHSFFNTLFFLNGGLKF